MMMSLYLYVHLFSISNLWLSLSLGRVQSGSLFSLPAQTGLVGDTAVLECNTSIVVSSVQNFTFMWRLVSGASLPDKARFTQNMQTLILSNLTIQDSQQYQCIVISNNGEFFGLIYTLNVFGKSLTLHYMSSTIDNRGGVQMRL